MRIFLSYSRADKQRIDLLRTDLEELGHTVWMDRRLSGGAEWWTAILAQIKDSDAVILALTESSLASEACLAEVRYARALSRVVVPIQLSGGVNAGLAPDPLPRLHWIPYLSGERDELFGLVRALSGVTSTALPDLLPPDPPVPGSYLMDLSETVRSAAVLDLGDQLAVLHRIQTGLTETRYLEPMDALLKEFRRRGDLLVEILPTFERVQSQVDAARNALNGTPAPRRPSTPPQEESPPDVPPPTLSMTAKMKVAVLGFREDSSRWSVDPDIPPMRLRKVSASFRLAAGEIVVAVFDTSLWGRGDNFFAITNRRLLHRDSGLTHSAQWGELTPDSIRFNGRDLQVDGLRYGVGKHVLRPFLTALRDTLRDVVRAVAES